jgi:hypothetical protein
VDTTVWSVSNGGGWSRTSFNTNRTSITANELRLSIRPCGATPCSGFAFSAGGVTTKSVFGYGMYTALIKAPASNDFFGAFSVYSSSSLSHTHTHTDAHNT